MKATARIAALFSRSRSIASRSSIDAAAAPVGPLRVEEGRARSRRRRGPATLIATLIAAFALPAGASAATVNTHPYIGSLTPPATATQKGPFQPLAVAVNQSTGNLYVVDGENDVIDVFKPNGTFLGVIDGSNTLRGRFEFAGACCGTGGSPIAIDNSGGPSDGTIYVRDSGAPFDERTIVALSSTGAYLFSINDWARVTLGFDVDTRGFLRVAASEQLDYEQPTIFTLEEPQSERPTERIPVDLKFVHEEAFGISLGDIAFDSRDDVYAVLYTPRTLGRVEPSGTIRWEAGTSGGDNAVDVDRSTDAVYAIEGIKRDEASNAYVSRYDTEGQLQESFGLSIVSDGARDLAVAESSGKLYVADSSKHAIEVFGPRVAVTAPDATAEAATGISETGATLNGTVNPQGAPASWRFQYRRRRTRLWTSLPLQEGGSGSSDEAVSGEVSGLSQNTTYEARLQAANSENGAIEDSNVITFTTPGQPQAILTIDPASSLTPTGAHLAGTVDPNGTDAKWHFEYTTDDSFEENWQTVGQDQTVSAGSGATAVGADLTGLRPNTHYFARLVATNETGGPKQSEEIQFTTPPAPPVVFTPAAGCLTPTGACLAGYVDPKNSATTYYFEYGTDEGYGSSVPASKDGNAGSGYGSGKVAEQISGLQPDTTYHFRLVAQNAAGTTYGEDIPFRTRPDASQVAQMEAAWPARGIELVNTPDKGNQPVYPASKNEPWVSVSPDGNRVFWETVNGGPQSSTGALSSFVATYSPSGWTSRSLLPPASQLPTDGNDWFGAPFSFTPDFSRAIMTSARAILLQHFTAFLIEVDGSQHVTKLATFPPGADPNLLVDSSKLVGDGRVVVGGGSASPAGPYPLTLYRPDGSAESLPVPACGYSQIHEEDSAGVKTWVNSDGSRIFLYSSGETECAAPRGIYMVEPETGAIARISGEQSAPARFLRANEAGTELLFTKGGDLYRWRDGSGDECLSCGSGYAIDTGTASPDLSHVYFCGPVPPASPPQIDCAIYVWRQRGIGFVADKSEIFNAGSPTPLETDESGNAMIFKSTRSYASSADDTGWNGDNSEFTAKVFTQLYRYDDHTGIVECVSCADPPSGGLAVPRIVLASNRPAISADGQTIAFATDAKLVPSDINNRFDVYEWHDGLIRLVTDGESEFQSSLSGEPRVWGFSPDGRSLFFSEGGAAITGNELDTYGNVYDARVGSPGFPPKAPPAHCVEDSCQGPLTPPPPLPDSASSAFSGPGNPRATRRHRHRRHRHAGRHRRHGAHHKRGGGK